MLHERAPLYAKETPLPSKPTLFGGGFQFSPPEGFSSGQIFTNKPVEGSLQVVENGGSKLVLLLDLEKARE